MNLEWCLPRSLHSEPGDIESSKDFDTGTSSRLYRSCLQSNLYRHLSGQLDHLTAVQKLTLIIGVLDCHDSHSTKY